ncbi:triose-phosphate isomerase [Citricoccus sp. SGAir0253]|uniref:triose-phosphate isomerase n=1 Tax=Citricoccus sp. SGAir0253 TaxID=2567881 RepID=UPI0010CCE28A|nr:triose-phosphate isomerase [Citricoccus sp. SGAir0253]QCU78119.1 triose-phosphate isomerase [Citricoccus sp. SGAir0253]
MTSQTNGVYDRTPLIAGNWKMNLDHLQAVTLVQKLSWTLADADHDFERVEVAVFPPFTDLRSVQTLVAGDRLPLAYGAQDLSAEDEGAYTGDVSGRFLAKLGCRYAIVGHSERRTVHGEDDALLNRKLAAALRHGLTPVFCVGEGLEVRQSGGHVEHTVAQLRAGLAGLSAEAVAGIVIAYEPVWAIGTGEVAGPREAQEMCAALRAEVAARYDEATARAVRLLYGGSVKSSNVASILRERDVDGVLVGGASLDEAEFASIVRFESHLLTD